MGGIRQVQNIGVRVVRAVTRVRTWQLFVILFFGILLAAPLLRLNNLGMIERRTAVIEADKRGDISGTKGALIELQQYVTTHMNTDLGSGVYLETAYQRDRAAAVEAAANSSNPNSSVYQQASVECRSEFQGGVASFRNDYVRCVIDRVSSLEQGQSLATAELPRLDAYRYDFVSPRLSFDLAGLAVLFCLFITGVILVRLLTGMILRLVIRRRYREV